MHVQSMMTDKVHHTKAHRTTSATHDAHYHPSKHTDARKTVKPSSPDYCLHYCSTIKCCTIKYSHRAISHRPTARRQKPQGEHSNPHSRVRSHSMLSLSQPGPCVS